VRAVGFAVTPRPRPFCRPPGGVVSSLWHHLLPPFDAWWPNIIAAVVWATPAFVVSHWVHRRHANKRHWQLVEEIRRNSVRQK
jgi:hypothetical protein